MMKVKPVTISNILYTTDLSDTSLHAFSYAASLANLYNASLTVLHVMGEFEYDQVKHELEGLIGADQWRELKQTHANEALESMAGKRRDNVLIQETLARFTENAKASGGSDRSATDEVLVLFGHPVDKIILETAKNRSANLIVMGIHGHSRLKQLVGSTANKVLQKADIPVLTVRLEKK